MAICKQCEQEKKLMKNRTICPDCNRANQREYTRIRAAKAGGPRKAPELDPCIADVLSRKW